MVAASVVLVLLAAATPQPVAASQASTRSTDPEIRYQQDQRATYGLDDRESTVRDLRARGENAGLLRFGVLLNDAEIEDLVERERRGAEAYLIRKAAHLHMSSSYGGAYIDHQDGGRIKVLVARRDPAKELLVRSAYRWPDWIDFVVAPQTYKELEAVQGRIMADVHELRSQGVLVAVTSILERDNVVEVGVERLESDTERRLRERYGDGIEIVESGPVVDSNRFAVWKPVRAGVALFRYRYTGEYQRTCTTGFSAYKATSPRQYWLLTAGHCVSEVNGAGNGINSEYWQPDWWVNGARSLQKHLLAYRVYGGNADALAIQLASSAERGNYLYETASTPSVRITSRQYASADFVGQTTCLSGIASNYHCGQLLSRTAQTSAGGVSFHSMRQVAKSQIGCTQGDSGGPWKQYNQARGIHKGSNSTSCFYTHISNALQRFGGGLRIQTSSNP